MHTRTLRRTLIALPAALLVACASGDGDAGVDDPGDSGPDPAPAPSPSPGDGHAAFTGLTPLEGAPGTSVRLEAVGFPAGASVDVGFGPPESEYEVVASAEADGSGAVTATQPVPEWAEPGRSYVWVLAVPRGGARAVSDAFAVAAGEATVRVEGRLTDEGVECPGVRADDGTLYTLAGGDTAGMEPGTRVVVTGTVAGMSICQQGVTLSVHTLERG